jgi:hypothetical protein
VKIEADHDSKGATAALQCDGMPSVARWDVWDQSKVCTFAKSDGFLTCVVGFDDKSCRTDGRRSMLFWPDMYGVHAIALPGRRFILRPSPSTQRTARAPQALGSVMVAGPTEACVDLAPGSTFGSKSATSPVYKSGPALPKTLTEGRFTHLLLPALTRAHGALERELRQALLMASPIRSSRPAFARRRRQGPGDLRAVRSPWLPAPCAL